MSTRGRFETFSRNITPSNEVRKQGFSRGFQVTEALNKRFYPLSPRVYDNSIFVGSLGKQTDVLPARDADILYKIPAATFVRYDNYNGNGQSALLQEVRSVLRDRYPRTEIRGSGPVVTATFSSGYAVEVIPAYEASDGRFLVPTTKDGGEWTWADYHQEQRVLDQSDHDSNGQTRRLIRMMKTWQRACDVPIKSVVLELRSRFFLSGWENRGKDSHWDDWMVRDFLASLIAKAGSHAHLPGGEDRIEYGLFVPEVGAGLTRRVR